MWESRRQTALHPERGFLPEPDPLRELPAGFAAWEERAFELGRLIVAGRVRRAVEWLPLLDAAALADGAELRRAMLLLSFLGHAYVWGGSTPATRLPDVLAVPWVAVADRLGRPPVLSYASWALDNWRRLDRDAPVALENLALLQNFTGGADEDWFLLVHLAIEAAAAPALGALLPAQAAAASEDVAKLGEQLDCIARSLERMNALLERMPAWCDAAVHARRVRPWTRGWHDQPALPDGVVYEGVARFGDRPQRLRGASGAQSAVLPALGAALGAADPDGELRDYRPPAQRSLIEQLAAGPSIGACVDAHREVSPSLVRVHRACLAALARFRALHLAEAART